MSDLRRISSNSDFEKAVGYSRAVIDDDYVHIAGTTGFDYATMSIADDVVEQADQAFHNIIDVLARARCSLADVVRVRYYLTDRADFEILAPVFKRHLGAAPPAATVVIAGLIDPRIKIEIEATARRRNPQEMVE
ncbi:MAG: RidA family protein [Alphaproteobacteria bacterium]|nr:RidA family protein [Alphaproteobacteria bacterium]